MRLGHGTNISDIVKHYKEKEKEISHIIEFCLNNKSETKVGYVEINDNLIFITVAQFMNARVVFSVQRYSRNGLDMVEHILWRDVQHFLVDEPSAVLRVFPEIKQSQWFENDGSVFDYLYELKKERQKAEREKILR